MARRNLLFFIIQTMIKFCIGCGFLVSVFFALASPLLISWGIGAVDAVNCQRLNPNNTICEYQSWRLYGYWHGIQNFQLQNAEINNTSDYQGCSYTINLITDKGKVYWREYQCYFGLVPQEAKTDLAQFHNLFNSNSEPLLRIKRSNSLLMNLFLFAISFLFSIFSWGPLFVVVCSILLYPYSQKNKA